MTTMTESRQEGSMLEKPDVVAWIKDGPTNTIIDKVNRFSERIAKDLDKKERVTTSQIRQVFSKMKAIEAKGGIKKTNLQVDFLMLKPQMAYAAGRHNKKGINELKDRITIGIDTVLEADAGDERQKRFKNFCLLFEAILSYHKAHDGS